MDRVCGKGPIIGSVACQYHLHLSKMKGEKLAYCIKNESRRASIDPVNNLPYVVSMVNECVSFLVSTPPLDELLLNNTCAAKSEGRHKCIEICDAMELCPFSEANNNAARSSFWAFGR